jgi:hypothetical protein
VPPERLEVVTESGSATAIESDFVAVWEAESVTCTTNEKVPGVAEGLPPITPVEEPSVRPEGSVPDASDQL